MTPSLCTTSDSLRHVHKHALGPEVDSRRGYPALQQAPEVPPQGGRAEQPHAYGTAAHALCDVPAREESVCFF